MPTPAEIAADRAAKHQRWAAQSAAADPFAAASIAQRVAAGGELPPPYLADTSDLPMPKRNDQAGLAERIATELVLDPYLIERGVSWHNPKRWGDGKAAP